MEVHNSELQKVLDVYYPVLEQIIEVQRWYLGRDDGTPKICPDVTGELISRFIKARQEINIVRRKD